MTLRRAHILGGQADVGAEDEDGDHEGEQERERPADDLLGHGERIAKRGGGAGGLLNSRWHFSCGALQLPPQGASHPQ